MKPKTEDAMNMLKRLLFALAVVLAPVAALAQGSLLQGGAWTAGHFPQYVGAGSPQAVVQDGGGAGGGSVGVNPSTLGLTARGTGVAPYQGQGPGAFGSNFCMYDAPTNNAAGYHYLCLDPNTSSNGALISVGAGGTATAQGLCFNVNGVALCLPSNPSTGFVTYTGAVTSGHLACWSAAGVILDCGVSPIAPSGTQFGVAYYATTSTFGSTAAGTNGQLLVAQTAAAPVMTTMGGDITSISAAGLVTIGKVNGVAYPASPAVGTSPYVSSTNTITYGQTPVTGGGTGVAALTANGVVLANGTSPFTVASNVNTGYCLLSQGLSNPPIFAPCASGSGTAGGANTQVQYNNLSSLAGSANFTWISPTLTIGTAGGTTGQLALNSGSGSAVTVQNLSALTPYNFNLPATAGSSGQPLISAGGGSSNMTFGTLGLSGGGTNCASPSGTCLDNITGFSGTGFISRTGAGTYTFSGNPVPVSLGGTGLSAGTSGGILGFTATGTLASSALLAANGVVIGGGAGATPTATTAGTNGQLFLGITSSAPAFATMSGDASITNGGVITVAKVNGVSYPASPSTGTVPTVTGSNTVAYQLIATTSLATQANNTALCNVSGITASPIACSTTQVTTLVNAFSSSLSGAVGASGGGTTNFLRADGSWTNTAGAAFNITGLLTLSSNLKLPNAGAIYPASNSTTAITIDQADGVTAFVTFDSTNKRVGINKTPGAFDLDVNGLSNFSGAVTLAGGLSTPLALTQGGTASVSAITARSSTGLNIDQQSTTGDAIVTIAATTRTQATTTTLTASRAWTLPAASALNPGQHLVISDKAGAINGANTIVVTRAGSDTINGATTTTMSSQYQVLDLISDGASVWSFNSSAGGGGSGTVTTVTPGAGIVSSTTTSCSQTAITSSGTLSEAECVNAQTGTSYAIVDGDRAKLVTAFNAAAQAYTIAQAGASTSFQAGWYVDVKNTSTNAAGIVTITPTTSTIDGASTYVLNPGRSARIVSDGTNYQVSLTGAKQTLPTIQAFTSGSGTYTTPANVLWIEIEGLGAGGGGAAGASVVNSGATGGNTCWNTSGAACTTPVLLANGGGGGTQATSAQPAAATASGGDTNILGGQGAYGTYTGQTQGIGGQGGAGCYGGGGAASYESTGANGNAYGSGGAGGGATGTNYGGNGGNAGACFRKIITSPAGTYTYAVGTGGAGGAASGTSFAGGTGAGGYLKVIEHYAP